MYNTEEKIIFYYLGDLGEAGSYNDVDSFGIFPNVPLVEIDHYILQRVNTVTVNPLKPEDIQPCLFLSYSSVLTFCREQKLTQRDWMWNRTTLISPNILPGTKINSKRMKVKPDHNHPNILPGTCSNMKRLKQVYTHQSLHRATRSGFTNSNTEETVTRPHS